MEAGSYVGLVGLTYRRNRSDALGYFQLSQPYEAKDGQAAPIVDLARTLRLTECLYLATCNRVELWFVAPSDVPITSVRRRFVDYMEKVRQAPSPISARLLHAYVDEGAWERLFVIAAALDAMVPGEAQVLGQLKAAVLASQQHKLIHDQLQPLVEAAFAAAKDVRENTALGRGRTSLMSLVESHLDACLTAATIRPAQVVVVGTGEMAEACCERLYRRDDIELHIVSRDRVRAQRLARKFKAQPHTLKQWVALWTQGAPVSCVLCASATTAPIFTAEMLQQATQTSPLLPTFIDLGVPPNVDAAAATHLGIDCVDYAALTKLSERHRAERHAVIAEARARIDAQLDALAHKMQQKRVADAVRAWRGHCEQVLRERLALLPAHAAGDALGRWARQLTQALAHAPTQGLKQIAAAYGPEAVDAFVRGAKLDAPQRQESRP